MAAFEPEVDELMGRQVLSVDHWRSSHDQFYRCPVDKDTDGLRTRDAAVAARDVLGFNDELIASMLCQNVRTRTL